MAVYQGDDAREDDPQKDAKGVKKPGDEKLRQGQTLLTEGIISRNGDSVNTNRQKCQCPEVFAETGVPQVCEVCKEWCSRTRRCLECGRGTRSEAEFCSRCIIQASKSVWLQDKGPERQRSCPVCDGPIKVGSSGVTCSRLCGSILHVRPERTITRGRMVKRHWLVDTLGYLDVYNKFSRGH